ncbi:MAG: valine--tRNA ligase [Patescibacteria group bacterium]|nr:valine--tRNA ligase [Patescibacteria group bacterium]
MDKSYNFKENEDRIYQNWERKGFFQPKAGPSRADNPDNLKLEKDAKPYTIVLPPPNVTGTLHMGHAGMLAIEDVLIRYHRMQGERTLWVPGTDHAAIATQTKVEKIIEEEDKTRHTLGRKEFLARVNKIARESHDTIVGQCKKMGASLDWSREAYTLDETRNRAVNFVFKLMYDDGLIYRGERIVNWCPRCHSTLADDEVEYKEQKAKLYYFKYDKNFPIIIATTRPETKLGDTAVAVNPKDERYKNLIGKEFEVDFVGVALKIKIIADREVDMDFGTGALGVTPAHSAIDWVMAENNDLEIIKVINEDGLIKNNFSKYSGKNVEEARAMIVKNLNKSGLMEKEEEIDNKLSLCYRCDTAIEPLPSLQWFIDVNRKVEHLNGKSIKETCLEAVRSGIFGRDKIKIVPERFEKNYFHWMENLRDWCISRQIWFGHQVPVWYKSTVNNSQLTINKKEDIYVGVEAPEGEGWKRDEDTLDTWFSSGMWTFSTLAHSPDEIRIENGKLVIDSEDFKNFHPIEVLETGYDILFFWVARMIIMTTYALNDIPFQDVYLHGLVLDEKGKKMSKSKGNVIDPLDMIEKYGTDATRLSLIIGSTPGNDMRLSEEKVAGFRNLVNKLWNIYRYGIKNYELRIKNYEIDFDKISLVDAWIIKSIDDVILEITDCLENYKFSQAGERLREFTRDELADWYLETTKFQKSKEIEKVLGYTLINLLRLWHPFIPFITEVLWKNFSFNKQLIISEWPKIEKTADDKRKALKGVKFEIIKNAIIAIRNARAENKVEPSRKVKAIIYAGDNIGLIKENKALIKGMRTGIESIEIKESGPKPEKAIFVAVEGIEIYLLGAVDEKKEKKRLKESIERLRQLITMTKKKLSDKNFVERAPGAIVDKEKTRLEEFGIEKKKLEDQFKKL